MENIVILGFGISGKSAYEALKDKYQIYVQNDKFDQVIGANPTYEIKKLESISQLEELDPVFVVKSPGISPQNPYVQAVKDLGMDLVTDLELAYRLYPNRFVIAITGTNGKTTTTTLVGEILKNAGKTVYVIGNIGKGILQAYEEGSDDDIYLIEVSSFQLEDTRDFKPNIAAFLNFSPDHLDWHGSLEGYLQAKSKIFANMTEEDILVLNKDNETTGRIFSKGNIFFSAGNSADYYVNEGYIYGPRGRILSVDRIKIPGGHNLENILAAVSVCSEYGVDSEVIGSTIDSFIGVEHRIEFTSEIKGVRYYNDSKGTNVDSTIKAVQAFEDPIILLAGGYDKKVSFADLMDRAKGRVKVMVLMGQTKDQLAEEADQAGIAYVFAKDMKEAVDLAAGQSQEGDVVLLSPACASWGMYDNFEQRGDDFKARVKELER